MAFLDNSGDIILDAVLTDTGRLRLARGDGSFKITKFAFGDDEIDYSSFNGNHPSGSAYFDLEILQTPIFEAFTNNTSNMKSKLISLTNNNLLYLPVLKVNELNTDGKPTDTSSTAFGTFMHSGTYVLVTDTDTASDLTDFTSANLSDNGFLQGYNTPLNTSHIRVDQGLDTNQVSPTLTIDPELKETQYLIEIDSRFAKVYDVMGDGAIANPSFIDDDQIASYYITQNTGQYIKPMSNDDNTDAAADSERDDNIQGPRGNKLKIGLQAATDVVSSDFLFNTLGSSVTSNNQTFLFIDTTVRITGVTTGFRVDIPLRILKTQD